MTHLHTGDCYTHDEDLLMNTVKDYIKTLLVTLKVEAKLNDDTKPPNSRTCS
jgi:hypothetical protein